MRHAAALICLGIITMAVAGCSSRAQRLYQRAEEFLAQGQLQLAAEEYRRIVNEETSSPLADDALYKLAYIYSEEMDQPKAALVQYQGLVERYPGSTWVDDSLMRIMQIQRETLKDASAVRVTWGELCKRFENRKDLCARGLLEVGRAHFDTEKYAMAAATADELVSRYSDQQTECAQAALLKARSCERMGFEQAEVEKLYEMVIERYPDTHAAAMAKQNIGWMVYQNREVIAQARDEELRAQSRVIEGVPAHSAHEGELLQALSALRSLLAHRGEARSLEWLTALVGQPFVIVFNASSPSAQPEPMEGSPFQSVAKALGFASNTVSGSSAERTFGTIHQALLQGHPVLVRYGSPARWTIVTGYDLKADRVSYMPPDRNSYATTSREKFLAGWRSGSGGGSGIAGPEPFHQFSLGARLSQPSEQDVLRIVVQRAAEVAGRSELEGAPAGTAALTAAGALLGRCADPAAADERQTAAGWATGSLTRSIRSAEKVAPILQRAEEAIPSLQGLSGGQAEFRREAAVLIRKIGEAGSATEGSAEKWTAAAAQAEIVAALHERMAQQLAAAAGD